jgi:hypothetical protein
MNFYFDVLNRKKDRGDRQKRSGEIQTKNYEFWWGGRKESYREIEEEIDKESRFLLISTNKGGMK